MKPAALACSLALAAFAVEPKEDLHAQLLAVRRIHVDRMAGGETANHLRDMVIASLQRTGLFVVTENPERADAFLRGSAEDLVFTDTFQSSEGINVRASASTGSGSASSRPATGRRTAFGSVGVGENESVRITERKHEAVASVRLVNKDGDVLWSTTKESLGAKFKGASNDVADKITKQLMEDLAAAKKKVAGSR